MILNTLPYKLQRRYLINHSLTSQQENGKMFNLKEEILIL